jgi:hypothetical protein
MEPRAENEVWIRERNWICVREITGRLTGATGKKCS